MSRSVGLPLAASITGHACILALLIVLAGQVSPVPLPAPIATAGIEVMLAPPQPVAEMPPLTPEPPPVPQVEPPPPVPPPPVVEAEPLPPEPAPPRVATPEPKKPPPARPKPVVKRPPQPMRIRPNEPAQGLPTAPAQTAAIPKPAAAAPTPTVPIVSAGYRSALNAWLESHKRYPDGARARGEEGRALLRFHVDRAGRVLNYAVVQGTGHPDLDAAIDQMMRGASLPPFPADMSASDVDVSVTIRFALAR